MDSGSDRDRTGEPLATGRGHAPLSATAAVPIVAGGDGDSPAPAPPMRGATTAQRAGQGVPSLTDLLETVSWMLTSRVAFGAHVVAATYEPLRDRLRLSYDKRMAVLNGMADNYGLLTAVELQDFRDDPSRMPPVAECESRETAWRVAYAWLFPDEMDVADEDAWLADLIDEALDPGR